MADAAGRRLRIVVLTWRDLRHPEAGGSEVYVHEVARRWAAAGHDVVVVTSRPAGTASRETRDGVRHRRAGGRLTVYLRGLAYVATRGRDADVVLDVVNGLPFATPLVHRRVVALVHHVHLAQWRIIYPDLRGRAGWFVESRVTPRLYRRAPWVTVSETSRRDLAGIGVDPRRVALVRNGLVRRPDVGGDPADRGPRVVVLARLVPHKRVEDVLELARRLRPRVPGLAVDVVGTGWWEPRLREEAERLGVQDVVRFHGRVDDDARDRLLAGARVMVLPSLKEGWGLAVSEAAAQGTPTVGYRASGGLTESVDDGATGWLADDLDGLVALTEQALTDDDLLASASRAARAASEGLDWDVAAERFLAVLRGAATGSSPGR